MYLSKIIIKNFRKYKDITINFHKGINVLIGENNSGKSTIIDAIKIVLGTQGGDYVRINEEDFFTDSEGESANEFLIDCVIEGFEKNELKNFIEFTATDTNDISINSYKLNLYFRAFKEGNKIYKDLKVGNRSDGPNLDMKTKDMLKCVYLKPLRDAEHDLCRGRNSRLSQILYNHPHFSNRNDHKLVEIIKKANENIEEYFLEDAGKDILESIRVTLKEFIDMYESNDASIEASKARLKQVLESLSLVVSEINPGLGSHNLLFIAAELLLLNTDTSGILKLALIEELEAHLHPQAQLRLINYLQKKYNNSGVQIIISTHSPILTSKVNVKNLILLKGNDAYDLIPEKTRLEKGDYLFLQRFLDSSKSNFFFAKGVIMVEGDAEALFIPTLAEILGINLERYGISIVNVGSIAFFRYAHIFLRTDGEIIPIPIAIITDCDVPPRYDETQKAISRKTKKYTEGNIKSFISPHWTFEYSLALSTLRDIFFESVLQAKKIQNSDKYTLNKQKIDEVLEEVKTIKKDSTDLTSEQLAYKFYQSIMLNPQEKVSKAIVSQCLASNLRWHVSDLKNNNSVNDITVNKEKMFDLDLYQFNINEDRRRCLAERVENDKYLSYIVDAIKYAAGLHKDEGTHG